MKSRPPLVHALLLTCVVALVPSTLAVPDFGLWATVDQVHDDHAILGETLPCRREGIVWNALDDPIVAAAVRNAGHQVCDKLMLDATITMVRNIDAFGGVTEDGQITIRIVFPLVKTPILVPLHNQDTNSSTFAEDAVEDARAPIARWFPYVLDLNKGPPCTRGWTGAPQEFVVRAPFETGLSAEVCNDVSAEAYPLVGTPGRVGVRNEVTAVPPESVGRIDRIFLLKVTGAVGPQNVYERVYHNVVMVNNLATEVLSNLRQEIEEKGRDLEETVFTVEAYLTESQAATGDPLLFGTVASSTPVDEGDVVLLSLPTDATDSPDLRGVAGVMASASTCSPTYTERGALLTVENGCVVTRASVVGTQIDEDCRSAPASNFNRCQPSSCSSAYRCLSGACWVREGYCEQPVGDDDWIVVTQVGHGIDMNLPPLADGTWAHHHIYGQAFRVVQPANTTIRLRSLWELIGDVDRSCDPQGRACTATGAIFRSSHQLLHQSPGTRERVLVREEWSNLYADPFIWCTNEIPGPRVWKIIAMSFGCYGTFLTGGFDHQTQAFNHQMRGTETLIDLRLHDGKIWPEAQVVGAVTETSPTNLPSIAAGSRFLGFYVEVA